MDIPSSSNSSDQDSPPTPSSGTELENLTNEEFLPSLSTQLPEGLRSFRQHWNPKTYQTRAIRLLLEQSSAGLFLDPGLGKTSTVLATIKILLQKKLVKRILIVAPLRCCYKVWPDEIEKWEEFHHLRWTVLHGTQKEAKLQADADIFIINPEGLPWLISKDGGKLLQTFDVLVVDESSKFKDSQSQRFKLLKPWLPQFKRRWILTGTPAPNGLVDLFGQMYILDLGRSLGRFITHFRREFFDQSPYVKYEFKPKPDAWERVTDRISPLVLQLSAEEYLEMPDLISFQIPVELPKNARLVYNDLENDFIHWIDTNSAIIAANSAVVGGKLRQCANGAVYFSDRVKELHEEKLDALESLLEEFGGAPCLIFYEFDHDRERIKRRYPNIPTLGGGCSTAEFGRLVDSFNDGLIPALICHPASVGHGLNLQGSCNKVVWFSIPWNLEHYDQAIARVYRQGQKAGSVLVYHIVARGTIDERIMNVLEKKDRTQQDLLTALNRHRKEVLGETSNI
jgi:SNF2 family DNA or RNA helicase